MELVRILVEGPQDGTVWVLISTASSVAEPLLTDLRFKGLADAIQNNQPIEITAEGSNVFYRFSQATGIVSDTATSATGTASQVAGVKFSGQPPDRAEHVSRDTAFLLHRVGSGATGILRIKLA